MTHNLFSRSRLTQERQPYHPNALQCLFTILALQSGVIARFDYTRATGHCEKKTESRESEKVSRAFYQFWQWQLVASVFFREVCVYFWRFWSDICGSVWGRLCGIMSFSLIFAFTTGRWGFRAVGHLESQDAEAVSLKWLLLRLISLFKEICYLYFFIVWRFFNRIFVRGNFLVEFYKPFYYGSNAYFYFNFNYYFTYFYLSLKSDYYCSRAHHITTLHLHSSGCLATFQWLNRFW